MKPILCRLGFHKWKKYLISQEIIGDVEKDHYLRECSRLGCGLKQEVWDEWCWALDFARGTDTRTINTLSDEEFKRRLQENTWILWNDFQIMEIAKTG